MKFLISLTIFALALSPILTDDGVDPTPAKTPIKASTQQKVDVKKIMSLLQQNMPETSKIPSPNNNPRKPQPHSIALERRNSPFAPATAKAGESAQKDQDPSFKKTQKEGQFVQ